MTCHCGACQSPETPINIIHILGLSMPRLPLIMKWIKRCALRPLTLPFAVRSSLGVLRPMFGE